MAYIPLTRLEQVPEKVKDYPEFSMFEELPAYGFYIKHVNGISFKNIKLTLDEPDFRPAFVFDNVKDITMSQIDEPKNNKQIILKDVQKSKLEVNKTMIRTIK